ncbi:MAG: penicillin-binding protein activator [Desulfobacteraceae bacterium]|nr:penicillin-binding protein activator [Desulfobacteraceae bacterium]
MIIRFFLAKKAIPPLMVGIAFFLAACQTKAPPPVEVEQVRPGPLARAEGYLQNGELKKALNAYGAFLEHAPKGERSALALKRTSEIYLKLNQPENALTILEKISREYPDYTWIPGVQYEIADILFRIGEHKRSANQALEWLDRYPDHPLKKDILILLGDNFSALGYKVNAFHWWLKAKEAWSDDPQRIAPPLDEKLNELISSSGPKSLDQLAADAVGTLYAPKIYYRMASIYLEQNETKQAKEAATSLIHSTKDEEWLSKGMELLKRTEEEMAVKQGVLGCLLPLSGPFSIYGEEVLKGIELGLGVRWDQTAQTDLELLIRDTKGKPEEALAALENLVIDEKIMAIIGPVSSRAAIAVAKKAQEMGVPTIALTQREGIVEEGEMIFRNFLTPSQEVEGLLDVAMGQMGLKRFGILYPDNAYGRYCMNLFWDRLNDMGGTVTAVESYGVDDTDFADQIKKMVGLYYPRPASLVQRLEDMKTPEDEEESIYPEEPEPIIDFDAVFIPDSFQRVAMIAPQLAFHDVLGVQLLGTSAWQSPKLVEMARDYIQGALFCSGFVGDSEEPGVRVFVEEYRENFDADPGILAANGYDTIRLLKKVLSEEEIRTRKDLAKALLGSQGFEGVSGIITFDSKGEVEKRPILLTISGNNMVRFQ